ncbi:N-acetyltransferase [Draconibacterium sp.]|nr:N-acetyltransferase [Draconibacterium sp.]
MDYQLIENEKPKQYEFHIDEFIPKIEYMKADNKIFLTHTEVPKQLGGKGIASALVKKVLEDIRQKELTLDPLCPFVAMYIKRHPEWKSLVLKGINIA